MRTDCKFHWPPLVRKRAKSIAPYLIQEHQVIIDDHLTQRRWEKDGKKFRRLEVMVDDLKLVGHHQIIASDIKGDSEEAEMVTKEELPPLFEEGDER